MVKQCIIIGGGPAGTAAALAAVDAGLGSVLLVERDAIGGTCTNRGCIPTKFFLSRSDAMAKARGSGGVSAGEWGRVLAHKNALVQGLSRSIEATCRAKGIEIARGSARFISPHEIEVLDRGRGAHDIRRRSLHHRHRFQARGDSRISQRRGFDHHQRRGSRSSAVAGNHGHYRQRSGRRRICVHLHKARCKGDPDRGCSAAFPGGRPGCRRGLPENLRPHGSRRFTPEIRWPASKSAAAARASR